MSLFGLRNKLNLAAGDFFSGGRISGSSGTDRRAVGGTGGGPHVGIMGLEFSIALGTGVNPVVIRGMGAAAARR